MKKTFFILALGFVGGLLAHELWYYVNRPSPTVDTDSAIAWMKVNLNLRPAQYERIKAIHQESNPRLLELAAEIAKMREEFAAFENERKSSGRVDFLEFARFVEQRRAVNRQCVESTKKIVDATAEVMTPEQRARYLELLGPATAVTNETLGSLN